ncbi:MAG: DUF368 domain-containing protein [Planctomycetales bacterium]
MGAADIIPGVSGGTVALILGIYRRLINALSSFDTTLLGLLRQRRLRDAFAHVDLRFLISLLFGIAAGLFLLADLMTNLLTTSETRPYTLAAFFGLILASGILVGRMVGRWSPVTVVLVALGAAVAYKLTGLHGTAYDASEGPPYGYLFLCGVIGISAMILPGISGAFILLLLGIYLYVIEALRSVKQIVHGTFPAAENVAIIAVFAAGCAVGLLLFSKILRWLLAHHEPPTMALLCGFMLGSLRKIWPFKEDLTPDREFKFKEFDNITPPHFDGQVWLVIAIAIAAAAFVFVLDRVARSRGAEIE